MLNLWAATAQSTSSGQNERAKTRSLSPSDIQSRPNKKARLMSEEDPLNATLPTPSILVLPYQSTQSSLYSSIVSQSLPSPTEQNILKNSIFWTQQIENELGSHAVWNYWAEQLEKTRVSHDSSPPQTISHLQALTAALSQNLTPVVENNATDKFSQLVKVITSCRAYGDNLRVKVFVKSSVIASQLVKLLEYWSIQLEMIFMKPCVFDGTLESSAIFTKGTCNILVVPEQHIDLDHSPASVLIFFDIFANPFTLGYALASYTDQHSHLIFLSEKNNPTHHNVLKWFNKNQSQLLTWSEHLSSSSQPPFPAWESGHARFLSVHPEDNDSESIQDFLTGCKIDPQDALFTINRMACEAGSNLPLFGFKEEGNLFVCSVQLHDSSFTGPPSATLGIARRKACFLACLELQTQGKLDYKQFPIYAKSTLERILTSNLEIEKPSNHQSEATSTYSVTRRKPSYWTFRRQNPSKAWFPYVVSVSTHEYRPFLLLFSLPLPPIPKMYFIEGDTSIEAQILAFHPFTFEDRHVTLLQQYTKRIFSTLLNKPIAIDVELDYLLAPLTGDTRGCLSSADVSTFILWEEVNHVAETVFSPLLGDGSQRVEDAIQDALIQDYFTEFTRRYEIVALRTDLSPLSKPPDDKNGTSYNNYIEFLKANRKGFEGLKDEGQPLLQVSPLLVPKNPFQKSEEAPQKTEKYFIPELCARSVIPASAFRTFRHLPAVIQVIDDFLLTKEFNAQFFDNDISDTLLREAITTPTALRGLDYERLELLGDSILKYLATIYSFVAHPSESEGSLHAVRRSIVSNGSLFRCAVSLGIPPFIQSVAFSSSRWNPIPLPPNIVKSNESGETNTGKKNRNARRRKNVPVSDQVQLGDKVIADVCEAIIGAAFLTGGLEMAFDTCKHLGLGFSQLTKWQEVASKAMVSFPATEIAVKPEAITSIQETLGLRLKRPHLLVQALTHATRPGAGDASYERLEYVGDAILDYMVVKYIFELYPDMPPSKLTLLKSAMVSNTTLAVISVEAGFHKYLLHGSPPLAKLVREYVSRLQAEQAKQQRITTSEQTAKIPYWFSLDAPKILSDVVESILAAIFLSEECDSSGVDAFWNNLLRPFYDAHVDLSTLTHQPNEALLTILRDKGCNGMKVEEGTGREGTKICKVVIHEHVLGQGQGTSRQFASREAMVVALENLGKDSTILDKVCNCPGRVH